jgi:transketolase
MMIELQLWHLISLLISFLGFAFGCMKFLLVQFSRQQEKQFAAMESRRREGQAHWDERFTKIETGQREAAHEWSRLERNLLELKADLPVQYVRREDYIRGQSVLEAKLDALYAKLEIILTRGK